MNSTPLTLWRPKVALQQKRFFFLSMAVVIALVVGFGFGRTVSDGLIHPPSPRPVVLYVHVALSVAWVLLFLVQAALVYSSNVRWHRSLGLFGLLVGALLPVVGFLTALAMTPLHQMEGATGGQPFLIVSLFDMLAFASSFWLAIYWRKRPEYHRRLMFMATCGLTVAAFARFPNELVPPHTWYAYVDALILAGVLRDWLTTRRMHPVYAVGLPALVLGQVVTMWILISKAAWWGIIANRLL